MEGSLVQMDVYTAFRTMLEVKCIVLPGTIYDNQTHITWLLIGLFLFAEVLKIDPTSDTVSLLRQDNNEQLPEGRWKWHGGLRAGDKIFGFPNNADNVLVVDCSTQRVYTIGSKDMIRSGRHRADDRYKYLGGAATIDERYAYLFPCDAEQVLRIDCQTEELTLVGPLLLEGENKFQNGFACRDGCLYGIPQRASGVLKIVPASETQTEDQVDIVSCGAHMIGIKDKFEGGVMGSDGCVYCIPLRARSCVKIIPGPTLNV